MAILPKMYEIKPINCPDAFNGTETIYSPEVFFSLKQNHHNTLYTNNYTLKENTNTPENTGVFIFLSLYLSHRTHF